MKLPSPSPTENDELQKMTLLYENMKHHPNSSLFLEPVDPIKHNCPDYFDKISNPMDLYTIGTKLSFYHDSLEFCNDVLLMLGNAYRFNPQGHFVRDHARDLGFWFDQQVKLLFQINLDWESKGINDLYKNKKRAVEVEKPRKRRLGSYRLGRNGNNITSELENLSSTLETMNKQLARLEKQKTKKSPVFTVDTTPLSSNNDDSDEEKVSKKKVKRVMNPVPKQNRRCEYCNTNETPMWRRGPSGKATLCNKCGVKWRAGRVLQQQDGTILPPPSPTTLSRPIKSTKPNPKRIMKPQNVSYAQKEHVAQVLTLGTLNQDQLSHIVNMIRVGCPELRNSSEEIELDIEALDPCLVAQMYRYVVETVGLKPMN